MGEDVDVYAGGDVPIVVLELNVDFGLVEVSGVVVDVDVDEVVVGVVVGVDVVVVRCCCYCCCFCQRI